MASNKKSKEIILTNYHYNPICSKCKIKLIIGTQVISRWANSRKYYHIECAEKLGLI